MEITKTCPICKTATTIKVENKDYKDWVNGKYAQRAFPYLTADQREILISGICGKCYENMFKATEEAE